VPGCGINIRNDAGALAPQPVDLPLKSLVYAVKTEGGKYLQKGQNPQIVSVS